MTTITEQFDDSQGRFLDYDAFDPVQRQAVHAQRHVDIRSFRQQSVSRRLTVFDLNHYQMSQLNAETMGDLDTLTTTIQNGEVWTNGTVGPQADRHNWLGLSLTLATGANTTESVMPLDPVDILTNFVDTDVISIALPAFPLASITLASSFVDFTSEPDGNFATGPTASVAFSASATTLVTGNSELSFPRSALTGIDLSKITGVRFRITATGAATFRVTAFRLLPAAWQYGPLDLDTRVEFLRSTPSRNGDGAAAFAYTQPTLWRTADLAGSDDPQPINAKIGLTFNPGSMSADSQISLFLRGGPKDFITQLDLDGMTMDQLDGNPQPDFGDALYQGRQQADLDVLTQTQLEGSTQRQLERTLDSLSAHWIEFRLVWGTSPHIEIIDSENNGYDDLGPLTLTANTNYLFVVELVDTTARAFVYELDSTGKIVNTLYDTGRIYDSFTFRRNKGRFGWYANLPDGDAYVNDILSRGLVFAELRTRPLESLTPVSGVELFAAGSSPLQLFENLGTYSSTGSLTVTRDKSRSTTGESWKVNNPGEIGVQGIKTNSLQFTDFENVEIRFDLFVPAAIAEQAPLGAFLISRTGVLVPLVIDRIVPDQWQTHHAVITDLTIQTGSYQLIVVQNTQGVPSTWWIDNVHIYERTLRWQARIDPDDPWDEADLGWLDFEDNYNRESAGVMFGGRGSKVQVRGQAIHQHGFINKVKVRPRYAELGRLIDPNVSVGGPPTATFTFADQGDNVGHLDASSSSDLGFIINYEWTFGDGTIGFGEIVEHEYPMPGIYSATLIVTDNNGNRTSTTQSVTLA